MGKLSKDKRDIYYRLAKQNTLLIIEVEQHIN